MAHSSLFGKRLSKNYGDRTIEISCTMWTTVEAWASRPAGYTREFWLCMMPVRTNDWFRHGGINQILTVHSGRVATCIVLKLWRVSSSPSTAGSIPYMTILKTVSELGGPGSPWGVTEAVDCYSGIPPNDNLPHNHTPTEPLHHEELTSDQLIIIIIILVKTSNDPASGYPGQLLTLQQYASNHSVQLW